MAIVPGQMVGNPYSTDPNRFDISAGCGAVPPDELINCVPVSALSVNGRKTI